MNVTCRPRLVIRKVNLDSFIIIFFTEKMLIAVTTVVLCVLGVIGATSELWIPLCQRYFRDFVNRRATRSIYVTIAILFEIMKIVFACVCICLSLMLKCAHP